MEQNDLKEVIPRDAMKTLARGGGITFFGKLAGKALKFTFQIFLTRFLGATAYGLYILGDNTIRISNTFSQMGLQRGVVRFGSLFWDEDDAAGLKGTLITCLAGSFLIGVFLAFLLYLLATFISVTVFSEPDLVPVIRLFSLSLPFYTLMLVTAFSARIFRKMRYDVGLRMIVHPVLLILGAGLVFLLGFELLGMVFAFLLSSILSAALGIYFLTILFPELFSSIKPDFHVLKIASFSVTVMLGGVTGMIMSRTDKIMLGILARTVDVGLYNAAYVVSAQTNIFLMSMSAIFSPIIVNLSNQGNFEKLDYLLKMTTKWIFTSTLPITLIIVLFPRQIMALYGGAFVSAWPVLVLLAIAQLGNVSVGPLGLLLNMTGYHRVELVNTVTLALVNIVLNVLLIPSYGPIGAALATGVSIVLVNLTRLTLVVVIHGLHPYELSLLKPLLAGLAASAICLTARWLFPFEWFLLAGLVLLPAAYAGSLLLLGLEEHETMMLSILYGRISQG